MAQRGTGGRPQRIAALMQREIADIIARDLERPATEATVTAVDVAPDLSHAKLYVTHRSGPEAGAASVAALVKSAVFLRRRLAARLRLRVMPSLRFIYDESLDRGSRIEALLRKIETERGSG
ncbi:MAG TPA: 30S ribosome-binding factor RbfA [Acidiferrobacteraceae bacterium]|nr:30S ribosome-binding factor RbfA [Acidiferrobacteraceae bacterium]